MQRQYGFSLLEIAVAAAVAGVGLAGVCALLIHAAASATALSDHAMAAWLAERLAEELALSPGVPIAASADSDAAPACTPGAPCDAVVFAAGNRARWRAEVARALPKGSGLVCHDSTPHDGTPDAPACDGAGGAVIKLIWRASGPSEDWARHVLSLRL